MTVTPASVLSSAAVLPTNTRPASTAPTPQFTGLSNPTSQATHIPPSPTPICDRAAPGNPIDVTIPDGAILQPGDSFSKTWRLVNTGSCTWTSSYAIVWFSGETLGAATTHNLTSSIAPQQGVDITVDMTAPAQPGVYQSNWKLQNTTGALFGIGPNGDAPFWVRISVSQPDTPSVSQTPTAQATSVTSINGIANLHPGDAIDLDTNQLNHGAPDDLAYKSDGQSHHLDPENGAKIMTFGPQQPGMVDCQNAELKEDPLSVDDLTPGAYLCYQTNQGLPGWIHFVFLNAQDSTLSMEILTWAIP